MVVHKVLLAVAQDVVVSLTVEVVMATDWVRVRLYVGSIKRYKSVTVLVVTLVEYAMPYAMDVVNLVDVVRMVDVLEQLVIIKVVSDRVVLDG